MSKGKPKKRKPTARTKIDTTSIFIGALVDFLVGLLLLLIEKIT